MMDNERKLRGEINMTKPKVEEYLGNWMNTIINNIEITTPKRLFKIIPNIKESDTLKLLEQRYQRLRFQTNSWTRDQLDEIKNLQNLIIEENKNLNETYWNRKIEDLQDIYNDPTKFWRQIRMLKGSSNPETPYLINEQNYIKITGKVFSESTLRKTGITT